MAAGRSLDSKNGFVGSTPCELLHCLGKGAFHFSEPQASKDIGCLSYAGCDARFWKAKMTKI